MSTESDTKVVAAFVRRLRRVAAHSLLRDDRGDFLNDLAQVTFRGTPNGDGTMTLHQRLPDEERFESLAARLRPFTLEKDPLSYVKAFDALDRLIDSDEPKCQEITNVMRAEWSKATDRTIRTRAYTVITESETVNDVDLAYAWLYGDLVHGDHGKNLLSPMQRFQAAVGVFSAVAIAALATLNLIRQLADMAAVTLPEGTFTGPVIAIEPDTLGAPSAVLLIPAVDPESYRRLCTRRS